MKQFYASIKLVNDQWNLQRVLYKPQLDPEAVPIEAVIVTLIWGIKCVSAQSEAAVGKLADAIENDNPRLAEMLRDSRFVDDLGDSDAALETIRGLCDDTDALFEQVGLSCKGWTFSGSDPPADVAEEGNVVQRGSRVGSTGLRRGRRARPAEAGVRPRRLRRCNWWQPPVPNLLGGGLGPSGCLAW